MTDEVKTDRAQVDGHFVRREASMPKWALLVLAAAATAAYAFFIMSF
jgi:hypothetical protein